MADEGLWAGLQGAPAKPERGLWDGLAAGDVGSAMPEAYGNPNVGVGAFLKNAVASLVTLPQRAIENSQHSLDSGTYDPRVPVEAALTVMGAPGVGGASAAAGEKLLGSGLVRKLPTDNYLGPVKRYTDTLYREMHPSEALMDLPTSVAQGGFGPGGVQRKFYADQPDLALGQGSNKGVRVEYDATPFEGQINQKKPAWDLAFQNGNGEYLAAPRPGTNVREAVRSFEVDPSALSRVERSQYQRIISNLEGAGWDIKRTADKIIVTKPK